MNGTGEPYTIPLDLRERLEAAGAEVSGARPIDHGTQYVVVRGSEKATLNVFSTGRVSEGGKESSLLAVLRDYRTSRPAAKRGKGRGTGGSSRPRGGSGGQTENSPVPRPVPRVGTDEAGKGEYLGPLVVAGVRVAGPEADGALRSLGVRDSKDLSLTEARRLAREVTELLGEENLRVVSLAPREYERRREAAGSNVNRLLGELNAEIIAELQDEVEVAVVDAFGVKAREYVEASGAVRVRVEARPRAEDDAAVAAASILARARYLEEMDRLSEKVGFELPRGSTHVLPAARRVYLEGGEERLRDVAKVHFSITEKVMDGAAGDER